jgi:putative peptidoglycan lipid II flippase
VAWQIAAFVLPVTAAANAVVFLFSYEIVEVLFARGNFTQANTALVADIQSVFAFQLVFYAVGLIAMRLLNAMRAADAVLWISCLGVAANALFDWLFYERLGASGIALSSVLTSVSSLIFALLFIQVTMRRERL